MRCKCIIPVASRRGEVRIRLPESNEEGVCLMLLEPFHSFTEVSRLRLLVHSHPKSRQQFLTRISCVCPKRNTDRKSTRLNSSHGSISYAVFCLKKKTSDSI